MKNEADKYLRENIKDLQEYAKKLLEQEGTPTPEGAKHKSSDAEDWNIRNWGNFYDYTPPHNFYNH